MTLLRNIIIIFAAALALMFSLAKFLPKTDLKTPEANKANAPIMATVTPAFTSQNAELKMAATTTVPLRPKIVIKKVKPPQIIALPKPPQEVPQGATSTLPQTDKQVEKLSPVNEEELMRAVVRIRCGDIYGSGFIVNSKGLVLTAGHVLIDAIEAKAASCDIIFPQKNTAFGFYSAVTFRRGIVLTPDKTSQFYKKFGLDVAALQVEPNTDEQLFAGGFPYIKYPFCGADTLDDKIVLFGYAVNVGTNAASFGSVLSRFEGGVLQYGDITGVKSESSTLFASGFDFVPELNYTLDTSMAHPVVVIYSNNNFSGASGGLVFDTSKNCIIGANSAVGTVLGDPRVFGIIYNFNFPEVRQWFDALLGIQ